MYKCKERQIDGLKFNHVSIDGPDRTFKDDSDDAFKANFDAR